MYNIPDYIVLLLAIALLFFGYKLKKLALAILLFVVGYSLTVSALPYIQPYLQLNFDEFWLSIIPVGVGFIFALLSATFERLVIFIAAYAIAFICFFRLVETGDLPLTWFNLGITAIAGFALGAFALTIKKPAIILLTSFIGAEYVSRLLLNWTSADASAIASMIILVVIFSVGAIFQFKGSKL